MRSALLTYGRICYADGQYARGEALFAEADKNRPVDTSGTSPDRVILQVPRSVWGADDVQYLVDHGMVIGQPRGAFDGEEIATGYDMAILFSRLLDRLNLGQKAFGGIDLPP